MSIPKLFGIFIFLTILVYFSAQKTSTLPRTAYLPIESSVQETPEEAVQVAPVETVPEAPVEAVQVAPVEAVQETPEEAVQETPEEAVQETPEEAVQVAPVEAVQVAPVEAVKKQIKNKLYKAAANNVVLISIDGLRPEFYLDSKYHSPTLKKLSREGVSARAMIPVFPTVTYPNHTTLVTGKSPLEHGIVSNRIFNWKKGPTSEWYWDSKHIKVSTLWDILERKGKKTASIHWPVTIGANISWLIPEVFPSKPWHTGTGWNLIRKFSTKGLISEIMDSVDLKPYTTQKNADPWAASAANFIVKNFKPDLTLLHLTYTDHEQHENGVTGKKTLDVVKWMDQRISTVISGLDKDTCIMIVGDHGFLNYKKIIHINRLFVRQGWIGLNQEGKPVSWDVIAHKSGGQAGIYLKKKKLKSKVLRVLKNKQILGYELVSKERLNKLGAYGEAIAAISAKPGFSIGGNYEGDLITVEDSVKGTHGYLPSIKGIQTGFIANGCGPSKGKKLGVIKSLQIAPTVLKILGVNGPRFSHSPISL